MEFLNHRGYIFGNGLISESGDRFIVNIPKNASSYMLDWANKFGYTVAVCQNLDCDIKELIVVLRDPVERWVSGISQYIATYILSVEGPNGPIYNVNDMTPFDLPMTATQWIDNYNQSVERLLFDVISGFDDHVWPQYVFFQNLLPNVQRKYFRLDHAFEDKIVKYLGFKQIENLDKNSSESSLKMKQIQDFFYNRLIIRPELKQRLIQHYQKDYQLIQQVFND
jgi:hypothetical protein